MCPLSFDYIHCKCTTISFLTNHSAHQWYYIIIMPMPGGIFNVSGYRQKG